MDIKRTAFQGVANIVKFNYHFYVIASFLLIIFYFVYNMLPPLLQTIGLICAASGLITIIVSLVISYYVYDLSQLYKLPWIKNINDKVVLNINAGFDETTKTLKQKYKQANIIICDFYDPAKHTEISIKRARKAYPTQKDTIKVNTSELPFEDKSFDSVHAILSAHEIRNEAERILFFKELNRITKPSGTIYVTEHLRDLNNFLAYTFGFLHFYSKNTWLDVFKASQLKLIEEVKTTSFISTFILQKNGASL